jgi:hypothetical protein
LGDNQHSSLTAKAGNRGTIEIAPKVLDWLVGEQYRRWKMTGKEPTQNELIREVIEIARSPGGLKFNCNEAPTLQLSEDTRKCIQLLVSIAESGPSDNITAVRRNLHRIYLAQQAAVLESAEQRSTLRAATMIARFLRSSVALRWGQQGWEIQEAGMLVLSQTQTIEQLKQLAIIKPESDLERDKEPPVGFVDDLLSDGGIERLDKVTRRAFRANQNRTYFEYLNHLLELYQEHSILRDGAISYPAVAREKIRFLYYFAWLYFAGMLHLFGIAEVRRMRMAQCSLDALGSLMG